MLRGTDYKCCADAACVALVKVPVIFRRMGHAVWDTSSSAAYQAPSSSSSDVGSVREQTNT
jgi:hypothetical protein